ncbi:hypothetical protein L3081_09325 [Colwellia sp. MSW7]|uniref:Uncharacterized protein n=1 Tax=Colwellia maritima TaxID=2912588 RepID=A0ABS9X072_9GAMM|nr:hypothetical protein [Colwellia maritima]MCI2283554.1 hypothetical protein [Colwellia maritima]
MNNKNATKTNPSSANNHTVYNSTKRPLKIELCLIELLKRGNKGLVELEALQVYGETCLHTTISTLANSKGIGFKREQQSHTHQHRGTVYFTRYSLLDETETRKAQILLTHYENKRGISNTDISGGAHHE